MAKRIPYLHRRGDVFSFRIAVPQSLRSVIGVRELTRSLRTSDRHTAVPLALELAAKVTHQFQQIRMAMAKKKDKSVRIDYGITISTDELGFPKYEATDVKPGEEESVARTIALLRQQEGSQSNVGRMPRTQAAGHGSTEAHSFQDAIKAWLRLKKPKPKTVVIYEQAVRQFTNRYPDIRIETVTREHISQFVGWMADMEKHPKTVEKLHGALRALLFIAIDQGWIVKNPASRTILPVNDTGSVKKGYTVSQLKQIFSSSVFAGGERPETGGGDAAFWVPLLALFTGARREEICSLTTDQVCEDGGIAFLKIKTLKTRNPKRAIRQVPVHKTLLDCDFTKYVDRRKQDGNGLLFPLLIPSEDGTLGGRWGDWWVNYIRRTIGIADPDIRPCHSFRHTFITESRRVGFDGEIRRALVGHAEGDRKPDVHDDYGEYPLETLVKAMSLIEYPGLDLSDLHLGGS